MALRAAVPFLLGAALSAAQDDPHAGCAGIGWVPKEILERPVGLRAGIGAAHEAMPSASAEVQALHDQGLAYLHSYVWIEAARSFHEALRRDPRQPLVWVALSRTYTGLGDDEAARRAQREAERLAPSASAAEQAKVAVRARHLEALRDLGDASLHRAYRQALDDAIAAYPRDVELLLLRGHAEEPTAAGRGQRGGDSAAAFYRKVFDISPDDFAAHHYLIHACENSGHVEEALEHGAAYARLAPAVPHAVHMYGHDLRRVGRVDEAIAAFTKAYELEMAYYERERIPAGLDWHHGHNLDLLATSYRHQGRMREAERFMRDAYELPAVIDGREFNLKEWPGFLLARGRHQEALEASRALVSGRWPGTRAVGHAIAGQALLALGRRDEALSALAAGDDALREVPVQPPSGRFVSRGAVEPFLDVLRGELLLTGTPDERAEARAVLTDVERRVRAAPGPDAWTEALFRLEEIARAARDANEWGLAAQAAGELRAHDAKYAGTHLALGLVAQHEGRTADAQRDLAEAVRLWAHADADLPELAQARDGARVASRRP